MLENLFKSGGRISKGQYQGTFIGLFAAPILLFYIFDVLAAFIAPFLIIPLYFLLSSKRLHDLGYSGKFALFCLFPPIGMFLTLVLLFKEGETGYNEYGPDPRGDKRARNSFQNRMKTGMREIPGFFGPITDMFKGGVNKSFKGFYDKAGSKGETHPVDFIFSLFLRIV